ncbi:Rrf2 family transcriptional regulator [Rhodobacteraceae bacterium 2376]|uniref:Rrf2 family transcriptional regulator n=1 Tax=Rhabdonatronobacter sediminivivens TaxID=2743469 RepID=A0A7Z0KV84_9RHOB|nr:Rrf2 family transcriptional regulator [Rhabdonatronobacter sediminivivens]NYS23362.1 Rrf2 family transcriptional regulator [Rhabdonatronobacter sediminivivens]
MRLTTRTNLALRTLMFSAVNNTRVVRKHDAAEAVNASENHLAQVINQLAHAGFITTLRGRHGGFHLARPANQISVGAVFRTFESDMPFIECFSSENSCPLRPACRMRAHLARAVEAFYATLDPVMLSDLTDCNTALDTILSLDKVQAQLSCRALTPA